jgi:acyl-coenzyme A thioesterase PaaI-like protein
MNKTLGIYNRLAKIPFGKYIVSRVLTFKAPYFGTIRPLIIAAGPGLCTTEMPDRRAVHNHLGTIHAIAMCNMCELTGGLAIEFAVPAHLRWIPKQMTVQYLKKAKGKLTAHSELKEKFISPGDVSVPIEIKDNAGDVVTRAEIMMYVSPRTDEKRPKLS